MGVSDNGCRRLMVVTAAGAMTTTSLSVLYLRLYEQRKVRSISMWVLGVGLVAAGFAGVSHWINQRI